MSRLLHRKLQRYGIRVLAHRTEGEPGSGAGQGNTGGSGGGAGGGGRPEKPISQVVASLISRHGDANTALAIVVGENHTHRARLRTQGEHIAALEARVPKDGTVVLSEAEAKDWAAYKALGTPAEVKTKVEKVDTLQAQVDEHARSGLHAEAAANVAPNVEWNATVLADLVRLKELDLEMRDVSEVGVDGKAVTVKRPHVRPKGDDKAPFTLVTAWVEANAKDYAPALLAKPSGNAGTLPATGGTTSTQRQGVPMHGARPTGNGGGQGGGLLAKRMQAMNAGAGTGNALAPATANAGGGDK